MNTEALGGLACTLVLASACMRAMVPLRWLAIASNPAFIGYAARAGVDPCLESRACLPSSRTAATAKPPSAS